MRNETPELLELIDNIIVSCRNVEERGSDPFAVDVLEGIERLREILPNLKGMRGLAMDGEALYRLIVILGLQERSLKERASSLYSDPFLIGLKLKAASVDGLAEAFVRSWRPVASSECMSYEMLRQSYVYWTALSRVGLRASVVEPGEINMEKLREMGLREQRDLMTSILEGYDRLRSMKGEVAYDAYIDSPKADERLERAVILSYLITFGYAEARIDPLKSKVWVKAKDRPSIPDQAERFSFVYRVSWVG